MSHTTSPSRIRQYQEAVDSGSIELDWRHELLDARGAVKATTDLAGVANAIRWGATVEPLNVQPGKVSERTSVVRLPVSDSENLMPSHEGSILHPKSKGIVRTEAGYVYNGTTTWFPQSHMKVGSVSGSGSGGVASISLQLVDLTFGLRSAFVTAFEWADGDLVSVVVSRILAPVVEDYTVEIPEGYTLPQGSIEPGATRSSVVYDLLGGCGYELRTDAVGRTSVQKVPPVKDSPAEFWSYGQADGIPVVDVERNWGIDFYSGWTVEGGSVSDEDDPITVTVYDSDPLSDGYFDGSPDAIIGISRFPYVVSVTQARAAAYAELRRNGNGAALINFKAIPNPALFIGDLVDFEYPLLNASGKYRIVSYQLPLQADGLMSVTIRRVYDPEIGVEPVLEPKKHAMSFFDDFNRDDENLENTDEQAGSDQWTEFGLSWGVVGNYAVQRWPGRSFALCNTPMTTSDHQVEMILDHVLLPEGQRIGPVIRSTGGNDGYWLSVNRTGLWRLDVWKGGHLFETLGTHQADDIYSTCVLRAVGTLIEVDIVGRQLNAIVVNDDKMKGTFTGMAAYGAYGSAAPRVNSFDAGPVE